MTVVFKNTESDVNVIISDGNNGIEIKPNSEYRLETEEKSLTFTARYTRDFSEFVEASDDRLSEWLSKSVGNAFVQLENQFVAEDLMDGDVIVLKEKAHYLPRSKTEAFFKCLPAFYYFAEAECEKAKLSVLRSVPVNKDEFLRFYKYVLKLLNLNGWFRIIKYLKQIKRQKKISDEVYTTKKFIGFYELSLEEREYQFSPVRVIFDLMTEAVLSKLPRIVRKKARAKVNDFKSKIFD